FSIKRWSCRLGCCLVVNNHELLFWSHPYVVYCSEYKKVSFGIKILYSGKVMSPCLHTVMMEWYGSEPIFFHKRMRGLVCSIDIKLFFKQCIYSNVKCQRIRIWFFYSATLFKPKTTLTFQEVINASATQFIGRFRAWNKPQRLFAHRVSIHRHIYAIVEQNRQKRK